MAHGHSGLTRTEAAVMDLWDRDCGTRAIARELGLPHTRVSAIVGQLAGDEQRTANAAIVTGSAALLAAMQAAA